MDPASQRRFFLSTTPEQGRPALTPSEEIHALRVLRLSAGDELLGIDGRGRAWPLRVSSSGKRTLVLEGSGDVLFEHQAGAEGSKLPWIELALSPPRSGRAEELVDRATQLGVSAVRWITSARTPPRGREMSPHRIERLERVAAEATKQCRRLWSPELHAPIGLAEMSAAASHGALVLLDPAPEALTLSRVLAGLASEEDARWTRARPLVLVAGPEGGFEQKEARALQDAGARPARLAPYVLRIETAVEAALAIAVEWGLGRGGPGAQ